jgi:hypothetical protein
MKKCPVCGKEKDPVEFHKDKSRPGGLQWQCIECAERKRQAKKARFPGFPVEASDIQNLRNDELMGWISAQIRRHGRGVPKSGGALGREAIGAVIQAGTRDVDYLKTLALRAVQRAYQRIRRINKKC